MTAVPLELLLPDGPATLVPGSFAAAQPRYERDGVVLDVDVTIPDDLEPNWFWDGSFLRLRTAPGACGTAICTKTLGVPGVFDRARELDHMRAEFDAAPVVLAKPKRGACGRAGAGRGGAASVGGEAEHVQGADSAA